MTFWLTFGLTLLPLARRPGVALAAVTLAVVAFGLCRLIL